MCLNKQITRVCIEWTLILARQQLSLNIAIERDSQFYKIANLN